MMVGTRSDLSGSVIKWVSQVCVSVGATFIATMIYGAFSKVTLPRPEPMPAMTSGGKFAARAVESAEVPRAYDGLDTMPLPRVTGPAAPAAPGRAATVPLGPDPIRRVVWDGAGFAASSPDPAAKPANAPERPAKTVHTARSDPKRLPAPAPAAPVLAAAAASPHAPNVDLADTRTDDGLLTRAMATARDAWAVTAATGGSLLARVVPQIP